MQRACSRQTTACRRGRPLFPGLRQRCWPVCGALAALVAEPVPVPDVPVGEPVPAAPPVVPVCEGLVSDEDGDTVPDVVPLVLVLPPVLPVPELAASRPVELADDVSVLPVVPGSLRLQAANAAAAIKVMARFLVSESVFMLEFLDESKDVSTGRWHARPCFTGSLGACCLGGA